MCVKRDSVCPTVDAVLILSQNHNFSKGLSLSSPISYSPSAVKVNKQEHGISIKNGNNNNNNNNNGDSYLGNPSITFNPPPPPKPQSTPKPTPGWVGQI